MLKTIKNILILSGLSLLAFSCKGGDKPFDYKEYYSGEIISWGNSINLINCATGQKHKITTGGNTQIPRGGYYYIEFHGTLKKDNSINIESILHFGQVSDCSPRSVISGIYSTRNSDGEYQIYHLGTDYSLECMTMGSKKKSHGFWRQSSEAEVILEIKSPYNSLSSFQWIPSRRSLAKNRGNEPMILVRGH